MKCQGRGSPLFTSPQLEFPPWHSSRSTPHLPGHCPRGCFDWSSLACPWKAAPNSQNNSLAILSFFFFFKAILPQQMIWWVPFWHTAPMPIPIYPNQRDSSVSIIVCEVLSHITFWLVACYLHLSFEKGRLGVQEGYEVYLKAMQETNCRASPGDRPFQRLVPGS